MRLEQIYQEYKDHADFYLIYLKEAHAIDSRRPSRTVQIAQHKTFEERQAAAASCAETLAFTMPILIDDIDNTVGDAFSGHPDRLFILHPDGTISYRGDHGPHGFDVEEMRSALKQLVDAE